MIMKAENRPRFGSQTFCSHPTLLAGYHTPLQRSTVLFKGRSESRRYALVARVLLDLRIFILDVAFRGVVLLNVSDCVEDIQLSRNIEAHLQRADGLERVALSCLHVLERSHKDLRINDAPVGLVQEALGVNLLVGLISHALPILGASLPEYSVLSEFGERINFAFDVDMDLGPAIGALLDGLHRIGLRIDPRE